MTTQPETRLMIARREWGLAKDADDSERAAWAQLHGRWLMERIETMTTALEFIAAPSAAYSRDKIIYQGRIIEECIDTAEAALKETP